MISFKILKKSSKSQARLGVISTPHGDIETPSFVPVATRGSLRTIDSGEIERLGAQLVISNTYHLHLTPGEDIVAKAGGLHKYMNWKKPIMTDSGGFQVFSLGFGKDHGVGKMLVNQSGESPNKRIEEGAQPIKVKITDEGVNFRSHVDGSERFLNPAISIGIQEKLGSDIMYAFDECPSPLATPEYLKVSLDRTHRWAQECINAKKTDQALYGIVQGGSHRDLRLESARTIGAMDFQGFGFGGEFGYDKASMEAMISAVSGELPENKPRHILGVGHPEDFEYMAKSGGDTFDCIAPTHYARHGTAFTSQGKVDFNKPALLNDFTGIDPECDCEVCKNYSRSYIANLVRSHEHSGAKFLTMHNVYHFNRLAKRLRERIASDDL